MTRAAFVVPRRADGGRRDELWRFVQEWWAPSDVPVFEGHHDTGPFNRSKALNDAAAQAIEAGAEVLVVLDADVIASQEQLHSAVDAAADTGRIVHGFTSWNSLTRRGTDRVMEGFRGRWSRYTQTVKHDALSCLVAVPVRLWLALGGFDERFNGWGSEDRAFVCAANFYAGPNLRVDGPLWHLWHPKAPGRQVGSPESGLVEANGRLGARYREAAADGSIPSLLREPGGPLS